MSGCCREIKLLGQVETKTISAIFRLDKGCKEQVQALLNYFRTFALQKTFHSSAFRGQTLPLISAGVRSSGIGACRLAVPTSKMPSWSWIIVEFFDIQAARHGDERLQCWARTWVSASLRRDAFSRRNGEDTLSMEADKELHDCSAPSIFHVQSVYHLSKMY